MAFSAFPLVSHPSNKVPGLKIARHLEIEKL